MRLVTAARLLLRVAVGVLLVVEIVLGLGVLLQALDANPEASFTDWSYRNQDRLMTPFEDTFEDASIGDSDAVLDVSALFAMAIYGTLFVPLAFALRWVGQVRNRISDRRNQETEAARQARLLGREPEEPASAARPGVLDRLRSALGRTRPATRTEDE